MWGGGWRVGVGVAVMGEQDATVIVSTLLSCLY